MLDACVCEESRMSVSRGTFVCILLEVVWVMARTYADALTRQGDATETHFTARQLSVQ